MRWRIHHLQQHIPQLHHPQQLPRPLGPQLHLRQHHPQQLPCPFHHLRQHHPQQLQLPLGPQLHLRK